MCAVSAASFGAGKRGSGGNNQPSSFERKEEEVFLSETDGRRRSRKRGGLAFTSKKPTQLSIFFGGECSVEKYFSLTTKSELGSREKGKTVCFNL